MGAGERARTPRGRRAPRRWRLCMRATCSGTGRRWPRRRAAAPAPPARACCSPRSMTSIRMLKNRHRFVDPSVAAFSQWLPHQAKENEASISSIRRCRVNSSARGKAGRFVPLHTRIFSSRNASMRNRPSSPLPTCIAIRGPRGNAKSRTICPIHVNGNHVKLFTPIFASQFIMSMHHPSKKKHFEQRTTGSRHRPPEAYTYSHPTVFFSHNNSVFLSQISHPTVFFSHKSAVSAFQPYKLKPSSFFSTQR